jgi:hypothetical protein
LELLELAPAKAASASTTTAAIAPAAANSDFLGT